MPKTYVITREQAREIEGIRKTIRNKKVDKRLHAIQLRGEGQRNQTIASKLDTSAAVVSQWVSAYCREGIKTLMGGKYRGNRRNMSIEEEAALLGEFKEQAKQGRIVEVSTIKAAYEKKAGHTIGSGQIYQVLRRHKWRKIMPRSKHPKKASDEAIEASKKLTQSSRMR